MVTNQSLGTQKRLKRVLLVSVDVAFDAWCQSAEIAFEKGRSYEIFSVLASQRSYEPLDRTKATHCP
jgi:hypothetical protein